MPPMAFTVKWGHRARVLETTAGVAEVMDPEEVLARTERSRRSGKPMTLEFRMCKGVWDTGATTSVVTKDIVQELGLEPLNTINVETVGGTVPASEYLVNLLLPNNVFMGSLRVIDGVLNGADVLVGMDVIGQGDLAVTNRGGKTWMTFTMPSSRHLDFAATNTNLADAVRDVNKQMR